MTQTTRKPAKAKKAPESYHVTDWETLYELKEQNKNGRETKGGLKFRKSVVSPYDNVTHDYLMRVKRMRVHADRHLLRSVYDDLVDRCAQFDRERRGWLVDTDDGPLSWVNLAIELELWDDQHKPDVKLLKDVVSKLESLGFLEKGVYRPRTEETKDDGVDHGGDRRDDRGVDRQDDHGVDRRDDPGGDRGVDGRDDHGGDRRYDHGDDDSGDNGIDHRVAHGGDHRGATPENQGDNGDDDNKNVEYLSLSDKNRQDPTRVGTRRQPYIKRSDTESNLTELKRSEQETEPSGPAGPAMYSPEWEAKKLQDLEQREEMKVSPKAVDASLPSASQEPPASPVSLVSDGEGGNSFTVPPRLSLDDIVSCALYAEVSELSEQPTRRDRDPVCREFAWQVVEALGIGRRSDSPPASKRALNRLNREIGNYAAALEDAMGKVPSGDLARLCEEGIKLAGRVRRNSGKYPNPGRSWRGIFNLIVQGKSRKAG